MRLLLVSAAVFLGQMAMQDRPVVRLPPNRASIMAEWGGKLVELINAPSSVFLPSAPPRVDSQGTPWSVEVKNLGPAVVTVASKGGFKMAISVGQTVDILSDGMSYSSK